MKNSTKGFVTVATGNSKYYKMAHNLLLSYKDNNSEGIPFAIITDIENEYTKDFDDVIIMKNATHSWMDKMCIFKLLPYDEVIFIDADCTVYENINFLWDLFAYADDVSCFGLALPLDSTDGWFTKNSIDKYKINFITHLHGILYYVRNTSKLKEFNLLCNDIISNYDKLTFKGFNDRLADEPVIALAMSIMNFKPIEREIYYYCFVPFADFIKADYLSRKVVFSNSKDGKVNRCCIVHWGNKNTEYALYKSEIYKLKCSYYKKITLTKKIILKLGLPYLFYKTIDLCKYIKNDFIYDIKSKIYKIIH